MREVFVALSITQTTTSSKICALRRMIFKCPSVIGSKLPGQIAIRLSLILLLALTVDANFHIAEPTLPLLVIRC